jgi:predicted sulfurtransferase
MGGSTRILASDESGFAAEFRTVDKGHECQTVVLLFYKYFAWSEHGTTIDTNVGSNDKTTALPLQPLCHRLWWQDPGDSVERLFRFQQDLCCELELKGRVLVAEEGINGTVSGNSSNVESYIERMKNYDLLDAVRYGHSTCDNNSENTTCARIFADVDWKLSTLNISDGIVDEPFPDLKISRVKEIVSTGGLVHVKDLPGEAGNHLTPEEFHDILSVGHRDCEEEYGGKANGECTDDDDNARHLKRTVTRPIALIDVRNTFEHNIGHFVHPGTGMKAMDPQMVTFSSFDKFCQEHAEDLKHHKVLMYCTGKWRVLRRCQFVASQGHEIHFLEFVEAGQLTSVRYITFLISSTSGYAGGIRCEKASVMLKRRGVEDVNQLSGGIHRYLEQYGNDGYFKGVNFTFDKRVAMNPSFLSPTIQGNRTELPSNGKGSTVSGRYEIVGRCVECGTPFDKLCGSRVCTVCRDLVLVCSKCQAVLREYHCLRHSAWKDCYFTFLEIFEPEQLSEQLRQLSAIRSSLIPATIHKNVRRTLARQIERVNSQINDIKTGKTIVRPDGPRRCRYCMEPSTVCDGRCWGFWKTNNAGEIEAAKGREQEEGLEPAPKETLHGPLPISLGDRVHPGKDWKTSRLGDRYDSGGRLKKGTIVQIKSWAGNELDCVVVQWDDATGSRGRNQETPQPQIYRWGVLALDKSTRAYDVSKA